MNVECTLCLRKPDPYNMLTKLVSKVTSFQSVTIILPLIKITLFEVSPVIHYSGVSRHVATVVMEHAAGSKLQVRHVATVVMEHAAGSKPR